MSRRLIGGPASSSPTIRNEIEDTVWIALSYAGSPRAIPILEAELASHTSMRHRGRLLIALPKCGDHTRLMQLLELMKATDLEGHIYGANKVFEEIAGQKFSEDTTKIELWLQTYKP